MAQKTFKKFLKVFSSQYFTKVKIGQKNSKYIPRKGGRKWGIVVDCF